MADRKNTLENEQPKRPTPRPVLHRRAYQKRQYRTNPRYAEKKISSTRRRRAIEQGRPWQITLADERHLRLVFPKCPYCGRRTPKTLDHVDNGGGSDKLNLIPACKHCNSSKQGTEVTAWLVTRRRDPVKVFRKTAEKLLRSGYFSEDEAKRFILRFFPDAEPTISYNRDGDNLTVTPFADGIKIDF